MEEELRPSDLAKSAGLDDLAELVYLTEQSEQTLINWFKNPKKRKLFECAVLGAAVMKTELTNTPTKYWIYGNRKLRHKHDVLSEAYTREIHKFALHCIEKFPDNIGHPGNIGRGTPRYMVNAIENPDGI